MIRSKYNKFFTEVKTIFSVNLYAMNETFSKSSLLKLFMEEREEIQRHKWVLSERAGRDVGYDVALFSWLKNHKQKWLESQIKKPKT